MEGEGQVSKGSFAYRLKLGLLGEVSFKQHLRWRCLVTGFIEVELAGDAWDGVEGNQVDRDDGSGALQPRSDRWGRSGA